MTTTTLTTMPKLLNTAEAAEVLGLRKNTLEIWRLLGRGPSFKKIGKLVRYADSDLNAFLESASRTSTSGTGAQAYQADGV